MGHVTAIGESVARAMGIAREAAARIAWADDTAGSTDAGEAG